MPQVPRINAGGSTPRLGSVGRLRVNAPVEAFGGGAAAQGLAQLGKGVAAVGQGIQDIEAANRRRDEEARSENMRRAKTDVSRGRSEAMIILNRAKLQADKALRTEDVDKIWNKAFEEIDSKKSNWLSNDEAYKMWDDFINIEAGRRSNEAIEAKMRIGRATEDANYTTSLNNNIESAIDSVTYMRNRGLVQQDARAYYEGRVVPEDVENAVKNDMRLYDKSYLDGALNRITSSGGMAESSAEYVMFSADVNNSSLDQKVKERYISMAEQSLSALDAEIKRARQQEMNNYFDAATEYIFAAGISPQERQKRFLQRRTQAEDVYGGEASKKIRTLKKVLDTAVGASDSGATLRTKNAFYETGDVTAAEQQLEAEAEIGNVSGERYSSMKGWIKKQKDDLIAKELKPAMKEIMDAAKAGSLKADVIKPKESVSDIITKNIGQIPAAISTWNAVFGSRADKISEEDAAVLVEQLEEAVRSEGAATPQARQQVIDSIMHPLRLKKAQRLYEGERYQERLQKALEKGRIRKDEVLQRIRKDAMSANMSTFTEADINAMAESETLEK